jgi:hypothetical protein
MRGALAVFVDDGVNGRTVTATTRSLSFTKQANGGHVRLQATVTVPRGTFTDLGPSDRIYVTDTRTGMVIWEGYLDAPTPVAGPNGEAFAISALGGMIRAADETRALLYVDKGLDGWEKEANSAPSSDIFTGNVIPGGFTVGNPGVRATLSSGSVVAPASTAAVGYRRALNTNMQIGAVRVFSGAGKNSSDYQLHMFTETQGVAVGSGTPTTISTSGVDQTYWVGESYVPAGGGAVTLLSPFQRAVLQLYRSGGATNVADDLTYADFVLLSVLGRRVNRFGNMLSTAAQLGTASGVTAFQVVEDLLGRLLTFCDKDVSTVAGTSKVIDQLAYFDGATAQRVLDDLGDHEPDYLWEILHSTAGGHIFNYRQWPTAPRYEISTRDGYSESGSDVDLANRVSVTWTDILGNPQTTVRTATSATYPDLRSLEVAGRTRDADPAALPEGLGSQANAERLGDAILADINAQPISARAVVRRPIRDLHTGAMVMPWEIETGYPALVRETGKVLRLTEMSYEDDAVAAALTLGTPSPTQQQRIAALSRV